MKVSGKHYRTIWLAGDGASVEVIDQRLLPHKFRTVTLSSMHQAADAISSMCVRGAPLIGIAGAFGLAMALRDDSSDENLKQAYDTLLATRPTAVNLKWALDEIVDSVKIMPLEDRSSTAYIKAEHLAEEDIKTCKSIGEHGLGLIKSLYDAEGRPARLNILTHCNAGWLGTVDYGTALAPIYLAHDAGIPVHVWVDETRPRLQGALTAWELGQHGVPHTVITDNAGGLLMRRGMVDMCIVGTDRTLANGDVCNKIGTYLKALAAHDNNVPFYVALPSSTIDWETEDSANIEIEERSQDEILRIQGVRLYPEGARALNHGFDITPARLVTALITERGVCGASEPGLFSLFTERAG